MNGHRSALGRPLRPNLICTCLNAREVSTCSDDLPGAVELRVRRGSFARARRQLRLEPSPDAMLPLTRRPSSREVYTARRHDTADSRSFGARGGSPCA